MTVLLSATIILLGITVWGLYGRVHYLEQRIFRLEHPKMFSEDDLLHAYLGTENE